MAAVQAPPLSSSHIICASSMTATSYLCLKSSISIVEERSVAPSTTRLSSPVTSVQSAPALLSVSYCS